MLTHDDVVRLYGPWQDRTPRDAARLLDGYGGAWWVAGGWAVEAFTGVHRDHGDVDVSIPAVDVPLLREHLGERWHVWAAFDGAVRPLVTPQEELPGGCENLWLRPDATSPWEYDVILMTTRGAEWVYERDARVSRPLADVVWERDGVTHLRPEVQLLHKAPGRRAEDQRDFEVAAPLLDDAASTWLRSALELAHPGHPWLEQL
ncbi:nucleotidyltransferase domain-containing protein [Quadrisphaera sp. INWT6]|uniref:nucleotidyltransferase domain-containing protein n=1 Tax=Quadrisphaera sp. INWT6 TaxID=2596917 RepID=UPI0019D53F6B|nr:hypothetical protein [Quadrisphaera sp. INWT6]